MPLNIDWKQILLHLFNFVLLFAVLFFLLYKPVKKFMDKRVQYYKDMDEESKRKAEDAEGMKKVYEEKLSAVDSEIAEKRKQAEELAEKEREEATLRAEKEVSTILAKARADGEAEKRKILDGVQEEIVGMVTEACQKAMTGDPSNAMDGFLQSVNEEGNE